MAANMRIYSREMVAGRFNPLLVVLTMAFAPVALVTTLADALGVMERLQDVAVQRRGRLMRLTDWFSRTPQKSTLPDNPRAVRPVPPFEESG